MGYMKIVNVGLEEGCLAVCQSYILIHFVIFYQPTPPPTQHFSQSESQSWIRGGLGGSLPEPYTDQIVFYYSLPTYLPTYPSPNPMFCPKGEAGVYVRLDGRQVGSLSECQTDSFFSLTLSVVDRNIHGTTKLVSYFAVLNYCLLSRTEKEMVC